MHTHVQIYYVAMYECTIRSSDNITTEKLLAITKPYSYITITLFYFVCWHNILQAHCIMNISGNHMPYQCLLA